MYTESPSWTKNVILYEIATKGFTSPNGPGSGNFRSTAEKLPYLRDLGINTIWLTGHQLCDPRHFYNIWTEYAAVDPFQIDESLGTKEDFKAFVSEAHAYGIRVILDVITHGLMKNSLIVQQHPAWFAGGSWGMIDFDWNGGHEALDQWWVENWLRYVTEFGIDGFRLDVAVYRPDLWAWIREKAAASGHEIIIVPEHSPGLRGMSDFQQHGDRLSEQRVGVSYHHPALQDMAGHIRRMCDSGAVDYRIEIQFTDGSTMGSENSGIEGFYAENLPPIMQYHGKTCIQSMRIRVENLPLEKTISEIIISDRYKNQWKLSETYETEYATRYSGKPPQIEITFPIRQQAGQYLSMQLSCHDNGWTGFPHQENPFAGRGSRFRMGYGLLLAPLVPVMMSGEEFNADFTPLPTLSPDLYGGDGKNGLGRWLYGNQLGWDQLDRKRDVLEDTRRMLDIRRQHNGLIHAFRVDNPQEKLGWVRFSASAPIPVPYSYSDRKRLIVVGGNPNTATAVVLTLELPDWENATVTDLFHQQPLGTHHAGKEYTIPKDCTAGGGLLVLELCRE